MKLLSPVTLCLGVAAGFLGACLFGRLWSPQNRYSDFFRIHPFLEQETSFYPTASQLAATARAQCPPGNGKTLVVLGGNSVFNGSGQKKSELWSRVLQEELGGGYHVINFSAPGAGVVDNGGVIFEMLARDYPRMLFVTNTEPGYYPHAVSSSYSYLFWDAYYKGLLMEDPSRAERIERASAGAHWREFKLGLWLNSYCYFNDLWTGVSYRHGSTVWTSWLKGRSFMARRRLPDWYDKRPVPKTGAPTFETMMPGHLEVMRRRKSISPERFRQAADGAWMQTEESLREERENIAILLPDALKSRSLIVFTPYNPWFVQRLTADEQRRLELSFEQAAELVETAGLNALSTHGRFEPADFGDTVHLKPAGGNRLAHLVAEAIVALASRRQIAPAP